MDDNTTQNNNDPLNGYGLDPNTGEIIPPTGHNNLGDTSVYMSNKDNPGVSTSGDQTGGIVAGEVKVYNVDESVDTTNSFDEDQNTPTQDEYGNDVPFHFSDKDPLLAKESDSDMIGDAGHNIGDLAEDDEPDEKAEPYSTDHLNTDA
jgi:hypothetical protein